ncbi:MAG: prepilin peptidase [Ilumatobacteraceae bacterium]
MTMDGLAVVFAVVFGLVVGSFLTVVVDRVPRGASIVQPGSACGSCGHRLGVPDLVPVFSWLVLRGRCRRCRSAIGTEPLVLEVSTASLFALTARHFGASFTTVAFCLLMAGLVALTWIDLRTQRLPREITYTTAAVGAPVLVVAALVDGEPRRIWTMVLGAAIAFATMMLIYLASRGGMGDGDVRLSPLLGLYLGWLNPGLALVGLFFGFMIGSIASALLMLVRRVGRKTAVPFGPFLAAGTVCAIFWGQGYVDVLMGR